MSSGSSHSSFLFLAASPPVEAFLDDDLRAEEALEDAANEMVPRDAGAKRVLELVASVEGEVKSMVKGALADLAGLDPPAAAAPAGVATSIRMSVHMISSGE
jgi:hypothetical protein